MISCMRTTIRIDDALLAELKTEAARSGKTLTAVIEDAVRGNLVPDAYLAALAIEIGAELISADRDFTRFPGLRWRHPLQDR